MSIERQWCEEKKFKSNQCPNAIIRIDKNSGISCLSLIFNLSNPRMTIQHWHAKNSSRLQDMESHILFFLYIDTNLWLSG